MHFDDDKERKFEEIFFVFFFKYKISRSVNNKAMVHQNTIFKNYFSIYWGFFFLEK